MDENEKPDGSTAMERLARELMENVNSYSWCKEHIPSVIEDIGDWEMWDYGKAIAAAKADILRRIEAARAEVGGWKAKAVELDALCVELGADDGDEALFVAIELLDDQRELAAIKAAGRIMPEGVSWPRYEDGELVRILDWFGDEEVISLIFNMKGCALVARGDVYLAHSTGGDAIKRPAPKAVGADGVEVKVGDTVWDEIGRKWTVMTASVDGCRLRDARPESSRFVEEHFEAPGLLTHERPDSWERLREDARKDYTAYWCCIGFCCDKCPALVDGKSPKERYGVESCKYAMMLDLVARAERLAGVRGDA